MPGSCVPERRLLLAKILTFWLNDDSFTLVTIQPADVTPPTGKRERILRAAVEVFAQNGYFNAKVSEVAKRAGVADGTIYLYFQGKEDLLLNVFHEHMSRYLELLREALDGAEHADESLRRAIRFHLEVLGRDRSLAVVFQVELRQSLKFMSLFSQSELAAYLSILRSIVEKGQQERQFRASINPQLVAKSIFGILDEMVTSWILSDKEYVLVDQSDAVSDIILGGLSASS